MMKKDEIVDLLNSNNKNLSIIELDRMVEELSDHGDHIGRLNSPQRIFYFNQNLEKEVNNGGFDQFFSNPTGQFACETVESLKAIGAFKTAAILQEAIDQFPSRIPEDRSERVKVILSMNESAYAVWEALDERFYQYEEDLNSLNLEYIRNNQAEFIS